MLTRFLHVRPQKEVGGPTPCGGFTIAYKYDPEMDQVMHWAHARCSNKDNFCKATGRTIAAGRLASQRLSRRILPCSEKAFIASVVKFLEKEKRLPTN